MAARLNRERQLSFLIAGSYRRWIKQPDCLLRVTKRAEGAMPPSPGRLRLPRRRPVSASSGISRGGSGRWFPRGRDLPHRPASHIVQRPCRPPFFGDAAGDRLGVIGFAVCLRLVRMQPVDSAPCVTSSDRLPVGVRWIGRFHRHDVLRRTTSCVLPPLQGVEAGGEDEHDGQTRTSRRFDLGRIERRPVV